jgi:archaeal type IV pilus assembly protein PilA
MSRGIPMNYLKRTTRKNSDEAVSPVVGVMLMLVVTIIIAAVVSGFAGGLIGGNNQKTPTLTLDAKIISTGSDTGSGFYATILSISDPIPTSNLQVITSWKTKSRTDGGTLIGGATASSSTKVPYGFGPGVSANMSLTAPNSQAEQWFGNYTLMQGTGIIAESSDTSKVLGSNWQNLKLGDSVNIRVVHIPTQKVIFQKDIVVTEG